MSTLTSTAPGFPARCRALAAASTAARVEPVAPGLWLTCLSPAGLESLGGLGIGWLGVDLQHGDLEPADLPPLLRVADILDLPVLARLPSHDPATLARCLDAGAAGVIVPAVESAHQAEALVAAARTPPHGRRSTGICRSGRLGRGQSGPEAEPLLLLMTETAAGLRHADAIAATPGVDGLFVGPYDLALSLGFGGTHAEETVEAVTRAVLTARRHRRVSGLYAGDPELLPLLPAVHLLAADSDVSALRGGAAELLRTAAKTRR